MQTPELAHTSDDDSDDSAPTEVVSDLKRILAAITAEEAEEYKKRANAELYQLSCREWDLLMTQLNEELIMPL